VISAKHAEAAMRFLTEFQFPQQMFFYRTVLGAYADADRTILKIASKILREGLQEVTERNVQHWTRISGAQRRMERLSPMHTLEAQGWLKGAGDHPRHGFVNKWAVNPRVHIEFAERAATERASVAVNLQRLSENTGAPALLRADQEATG
jgi:hypothetical protein